MTDFWVALWTIVWFGGLAVFSVLSVMVIIFGGYDLVALLASLRRRHQEPQTEQLTGSGPA